jgi:hypothetical protein
MGNGKRIDTEDPAFNKKRKPIKRKLKIRKTYSEEEATDIKRKKIKFIEYYKGEGVTIAKALKKCNIPSQQEIYDWMDDDPLFRERYYVIRKQKDPLSFYKEQKEEIKEPVPISLEDGEDVKALKNAVIEAYRYSSFNLTEACDEVGIQRLQVVKWLQEDPEFQNRMEGVDEEKKDLVESSLLQKVASGDIAAIIYASKCLLSGPKGRGYDENKTLNARIDVVHSKETADAVIEAAQITPANIADTPAGKFLIERMNNATEDEAIDTEVEEVTSNE